MEENITNGQLVESGIGKLLEILHTRDAEKLTHMKSMTPAEVSAIMELMHLVALVNAVDEAIDKLRSN